MHWHTCFGSDVNMVGLLPFATLRVCEGRLDYWAKEVDERGISIGRPLLEVCYYLFIYLDIIILLPLPYMLGEHSKVNLKKWTRKGPLAKKHSIDLAVSSESGDGHSAAPALCIQRTKLRDWLATCLTAEQREKTILYVSCIPEVPGYLHVSVAQI
jgi:hypothetical protein